MVNPAKRMRHLQKLLQIRTGPGAAVLPPPPAPRLRKIEITIPQRPSSARAFRRNYLPSIKFYNPTLEIVQHEDVKGSLLELEFEDTDPEALKAVLRKHDAGTEAWYREAFEQYKNRVMMAGKPTNKELDPVELPSVDARISLKTTEETSSSPNMTSQPLYQAKVALKLKRTTAEQAWSWFSELTGSIPQAMSEEDKKLSQKVAEFDAQSEKDRRQVKASLDKVKAEQEELRKAKEAVDRLSADAV